MNEFFERLFSSHFLPKFLTGIGFLLVFYSSIALFMYKSNPLISIDYFFYLLIGTSLSIYGFLIEHSLKQTELLKHSISLLSGILKVEFIERNIVSKPSQLDQDNLTEFTPPVVSSDPIISKSVHNSDLPSRPTRVVKPVSPEEQARVKEQVRERIRKLELEQRRLSISNRDSVSD